MVLVIFAYVPKLFERSDISTKEMSVDKGMLRPFIDETASFSFYQQFLDEFVEAALIAFLGKLFTLIHFIFFRQTLITTLLNQFRHIGMFHATKRLITNTDTVGVTKNIVLTRLMVKDPLGIYRYVDSFTFTTYCRPGSRFNTL